MATIVIIITAIDPVQSWVKSAFESFLVPKPNPLWVVKKILRATAIQRKTKLGLVWWL